MSKTFPISKVIETTKGPIKEITLREPCMGDLKALDEFVEGDKFNWDRLSKWVARLAGLDMITVDQIPPRDFGDPAAWIVAEMAWGQTKKENEAVAKNSD